MSDTDIWIVIACLVLATALTRSSLWLVGHRIQIPKRVQEALRYAPACALAAIVVPDLLLSPDQQLVFSLGNAKLLAGVAAIAFFAVRRNMMQTIVLGMLLFTALRLLLPPLPT